MTNKFKFKLRCYGVLMAVLMASFIVDDKITLTDEPSPFKTNGFYINTVTDQRLIKGSVALIAVGNNNPRPVLQKADLQGGTAGGVERFIDRNVVKEASALPVSLAIKEFKLTENVLPDGRIDGRIVLSLSMGQQKNYGVEELAGYKGGLHYIRQLNNNKIIEVQLRSVIRSGLAYFNKWMEINLAGNPKLAKSVKFSFTDHLDKVEGDTIYYSPSRPLTWADFQSKVRPDGPFEASVMPNIGYNIREEVKNGVIHVSIAFKTFVAKSDCWSNGTHSAYALAHEQKHFDIARVITKQYKQKIINANLRPDNYQAFISMQYLDSYRDMNAMQRAYDRETRHGQDEYAQSEWNKKIAELLED